MARRRSVLAAAALPALAGCMARMTAGPEVSKIDTIGLLTPYIPGSPSVPMLANAGIGFGLVGAVIEAGIRGERERKLIQALAGKDLRGTWIASLRTALEAAGYRVVDVPVARPGMRFLAARPEGAAEALLDVVIFEYGLRAVSPAAPFRPYAMVRVRLTAGDGRTLFEDFIMLNAGGIDGLSTQVTSAPGHEIATSSEFESQPARAAAAVDEAIRACAEAIVSTMRGGHAAPGPRTALLR
jgi:hypothetical protein